MKTGVGEETPVGLHRRQGGFPLAGARQGVPIGHPKLPVRGMLIENRLVRRCEPITRDMLSAKLRQDFVGWDVSRNATDMVFEKWDRVAAEIDRRGQYHSKLTVGMSIMKGQCAPAMFDRLTFLESQSYAGPALGK